MLATKLSCWIWRHTWTTQVEQGELQGLHRLRKVRASANSELTGTPGDRPAMHDIGATDRKRRSGCEVLAFPARRSGRPREPALVTLEPADDVESAADVNAGRETLRARSFLAVGLRIVLRTTHAGLRSRPRQRDVLLRLWRPCTRLGWMWRPRSLAACVFGALIVGLPSSASSAAPAGGHLLQTRGMWTYFEHRGASSGYHAGELLEAISGAGAKSDVVAQLRVMRSMGVNELAYEMRSADGPWPVDSAYPACKRSTSLGPPGLSQRLRRSRGCEPSMALRISTG